uniref:Anaphase-promoting complex subunit 1 n=1 Tax=Cryptococcus bacillisporus CA1280 TaxID=1296109 RepID=A0A0D0UCQ2_CRYGA|nr:anaphase-promoting complex subunit 1 [Cryptococcus bacillisporus CA1280]
MLEASLLGPATSPGQLLSSRSSTGSSRDLLRNSFPVTSPGPDIHDAYGQSQNNKPKGRVIAAIENESGRSDEWAEEELVWYDKTVVWSRGAELFRRYTFEHEGEVVAFACFAWFKSGEESDSSGKHNNVLAQNSAASETFGPFHRSQHMAWGGPRSASHPQSQQLHLERTLVIFLQTRAHIYYRSGEDITVYLPFSVDGAWGLPDGGVLIQRELEKRELRKMNKDKRKAGSVLRGMADQTSMSVLDDLMDLEDDSGHSLPRLYVLENPFDELKMAVYGQVEGGYGSKPFLSSPSQPLGANSSILYVSPEPYPFVVTHNQESGAFVIYRYVRIQAAPEHPTSTFNPRTMRPEELLRQPDNHQLPVQPCHSRPSLHRNTSSFGPTGGDRRLSSAADPLDRTQRRAPRLSRGPLPDVASTDELQAVLEPPSNIPATSVGHRRSRGISLMPTATPRPSFPESKRRTSTAASFILHDINAPQNKMALHVAAEKDLRETTMMMGLERDEVGIRSEVVFQALATWKQPFRAPIFASSPGQNIYDTLILPLGDGSGPQLVTIGRKQYPISLPTEVSQCSRSSPKPIKFVDPVGPRFTAVFANGDSMRFSAAMYIRHELTQRCIEALSGILNESIFAEFKIELLSEFQALPGCQRDDPDAMWRVFEETLSSMSGLQVEKRSFSTMSRIVQDSTLSLDAITRRLAARIKSKQVPLSPPSEYKQISFKTSVDRSLPGILFALHLIAQDFRLSLSHKKDLSRVVKLVIKFALQIGKRDWVDYWERIMPMEVTGHVQVREGTFDTHILDQFDTPPDIMLSLSRHLACPSKGFPLLGRIIKPLGRDTNSAHAPMEYSDDMGLLEPCPRIRVITSIYKELGLSINMQSQGLSLSQRAKNALKVINSEVPSAEWLRDLPHGVSLPILEILRACQYAPDDDWTREMYMLVGRPDMAMKAIKDKRYEDLVKDDWPSGLGPERLPTIGQIMSQTEAGKTDAKTKKNAPLVLPHVRFGTDRRLQEVERIMQTTKLRIVSLSEPKGASADDITRYQQSFVNTLANRTLSITVGQGMFEYGTRVATITDVWEIPFIELSVKITPGNNILKAEIVSDSAEWPCFHNGVSAGLSISPDCKGIDSSWIVFNRPQTLNSEHGGFLLGLGLTGHLRSLLTYHAFPLMEPRHDFTSVGLLLGLASSYAGSGDLLITKILSLHTHALLPLGSMELNASPIIQSTALVGLGLVYVGSRNLRMAEVALSEVGRLDMPNVQGFGEYQESYSFSASIAYGLIMLGRGGSTASEVDRKMLAQLRRCIVGDMTSLDSSKGRSDFPGVDINITAPGATLALGLAYLKTMRKDVADLLDIPQTAFSLDQVKPEWLLLRTFARALIMWDSVVPTTAWVEEQIPAFILSGMKESKQTGSPDLTIELAYLNIISGAGLAIGLKYAGTATELAHNTILSLYSTLAKAVSGQGMNYEGRIKRTSARQGLNVVTIALAAVMSGTGELGVLRRLRVSHGQEGAGVNYGTHMAMHMALGLLFLGRGQYTLGNSNLAIAAMAIAFFPRFLPNPSDNKAYPQAFRHLWALSVEARCLTARDVETLETVYLPVKLRFREGNSVRQQSLISPTQLPSFDRLLTIEVDSPRYWPIRIDLSNPRDMEKLIRTRTIYVKRKAGFIDYDSDPKGNRSIFVRVGSMTGIDLHYDLISSGAPPSVPQEEISELVRIHSGDASLVGLANHFTSVADDFGSGIGTFLRTVIIECLALDKPRLIDVYLEMYLSLRRENARLRDPTLSSSEILDGMEDILQFGLIKGFYDEHYEKNFAQANAAGEKRFALVRHSFINAARRSVLKSSSEETESHKVGEYVLNGVSAWESDARKIAKWLARNGVPPLPLLEALKQRLYRKGLAGTEIELKMRRSAEKYWDSVVKSYDEGPAPVYKGDAWKLNSVQQIIDLWQ